ncbi:HutD family protein [Serratia ureilytica]
MSWPPGAQDFDWRASIATIAQDGPFSAFAGIDRSITLLEGDGVRLFSAGHIDHQLARVGSRSRSPATWRWKRLLGGASQDFNIMTRRGRQAAEVRRSTAPVTLPPNRAGVLWVLNGVWSLPGAANCGRARASGGRRRRAVKWRR